MFFCVHILIWNLNGVFVGVRRCISSYATFLDQFRQNRREVTRPFPQLIHNFFDFFSVFLSCASVWIQMLSLSVFSFCVCLGVRVRFVFYIHLGGGLCVSSILKNFIVSTAPIQIYSVGFVNSQMCIIHEIQSRFDKVIFSKFNKQTKERGKGK